MLILGLTGSIATGKSSVSTILAQAPFSLPIIDADVLARQVVAPETPGYAQIVAHFLPTTPDLLLPPSDPAAPAGAAPLNRAALGRRVFGDSAERQRDRAILNAIVHPAVRREIVKAVLGAYLRGAWAVVLDVPLLFESGLDLLCGTVIVVAIRDPEVQIKRLMERDQHLSRAEAEDRVRSQSDVRAKAKRCLARGAGRGEVIWNDRGKEELRLEIEEIMAKVKKASPTWWNWLLLLCPPMAALVGLWNYFRAFLAHREWKKHELQAKAN